MIIYLYTNHNKKINMKEKTKTDFIALSIKLPLKHDLPYKKNLYPLIIG